MGTVTQSFGDFAFDRMMVITKGLPDSREAFSAASRVVSHLNLKNPPKNVDEGRAQLDWFLRERAYSNYGLAFPPTAQEINSLKFKTEREKLDHVDSLDFDALVKAVDENTRQGFVITEQIVEAWNNPAHALL